MIRLTRVAMAQWIGYGLIWLGGIATIRFAFRLRTLEKAIPGFSELGLVSPVLLLASGIACVLLGNAHKRVLGLLPRRVVLACVALLAAFPSLMLAENLTGVNLGVDFAFADIQPTPTNPFPGRMSLNACVAFGLAGLVIQMMLRPVNTLSRRMTLGFIYGVALIGAVGCIGHVLHFERLYRLGPANALALPVAYGLMILSTGLWQLRERWIVEPGEGLQRHEQRIGQRSIAVLGAVAIAAGVGGFALIQANYEQSQGDGLLLTATANADAFAHTLQVSAWFPRTVATRPEVGQSLYELRSNAADPQYISRLRRAGEDFLTAGVSGVRFESNEGADIVTVGQLMIKPTDATLTLSAEYARSKLVWKGGYYLYSQYPVMAQGQQVGRIALEQPLPLIDKLVANIYRASDSSDVLVCNSVGAVASCVPSRFYAVPFTIPMLDANGAPNFPINRALLGQTGVLMTKDLRGIPTIAAYAPVAATGLGIVAKMNAETLYAPLRARLNLLGSLLIVLVVAGWWALRSQVRPLVAQISAARREIAASEKHLRDIADNLPVLIGYISKERKLMFANQAFAKWMGLDPEQLEGKPVAALGTSIYEERSDLLAAAFAGQRVEYESLSNKMGVVRNLHTVLVPHLQSDGHAAGVYALTTDVSAGKAAERHLHQLALVDALTGLPNRRAFEERLEQATARSRSSGRPMALIFLDIDHFKEINDSFGHGAGDEVLRELAVRLQTTIRITDFAARLAGDEFVVILEGLTTAAEASIVAEKLAESIRLPMRTVNHALSLDVTATMGVAYYEGGAGGGDDLLERADRALYRAKEAGRNTFAATAI